MDDIFNLSINTELISSSLIFFLSPIIIMIAIIIIYSIYQRKTYSKSEYFAATKTPYSTMRRDSGLYGEYLIYRQLKKLLNTPSMFQQT